MNEAHQIHVLVVDDHDMVRRGLAAFLKAFADLELAGEAASGEEAVRLAVELQPDVVLMDLVLPGIDGAVAIRTIREQLPRTQVLALTSFREDVLVQSSMQAGAIGYLLKNVSADELADAIRAVHAGRPVLAPEAVQALLRGANQPRVPGGDLTVREREVLSLLVKGLSNTEIARQLTVSRSTVKTHVSKILAKLNVTSRTEAVALAVQHQLTF